MGDSESGRLRSELGDLKTEVALLTERVNSLNDAHSIIDGVNGFTVRVDRVERTLVSQTKLMWIVIAAVISTVAKDIFGVLKGG